MQCKSGANTISATPTCWIRTIVRARALWRGSGWAGADVMADARVDAERGVDRREEVAVRALLE